MSINYSAPSPFESFNARALSAPLVARTFVPPGHFSRLVQRRHHLLIGPRGSGKTTLLKMLQPAALNAWNHIDAEDYRAKVDYTGVFIPTDISWQSQLTSLTEGGLTSAEALLIVRASFTTSVLLACVTSLSYRNNRKTTSKTGFRQIEISKISESDISDMLGGSWHLEVDIPSLTGLQFALRNRLSQLNSFANRELVLGITGRTERLSSAQSLHLSFLPCVSLFLDAVEIAIPETSGQRWALLFDELELAPGSVREELFRALRSVDERLLFKLSISPYSREHTVLSDPSSAMPGHDHDEINLTYANPNDSKDFCDALFGQMLGIDGWEMTDADRILGESEFAREHADSGDGFRAYGPKSRVGMQFRKLYDSDQSFQKYIDDRDIDIERLHELPSEIMDKNVRKLRSLVAVRTTFRTPDSVHENTRRRVRGRRAPALYAGSRALFAMSEGNPRWLIGVVSQLLIQVDEKDRRVPASLQSHEIQQVSDRFRALLKTIPTPMSPKSFRGVLSILDEIGLFVFDQVVRDSFTPDPVGSFIVDSKAPDWIIDIIGKSLNAGAIVYVPDSDASPMLSSLRGKRFRISYVLSPYYEIPILQMRAISLSTILKRRSVTLEGQMELGDTNDF
nr:hypothetical protein [Rhodococcus sp. (in: high G+C Gram-positive bacteria)]